MAQQGRTNEWSKRGTMQDQPPDKANLPKDPWGIRSGRLRNLKGTKRTKSWPKFHQPNVSQPTKKAMYGYMVLKLQVKRGPFSSTSAVLLRPTNKVSVLHKFLFWFEGVWYWIQVTSTCCNNLAVQVGPEWVPKWRGDQQTENFLGEQSIE